MADEKTFGYLYFTPKEVNGKPQPGKFNTLKVRFLYTSTEQIPMGRVHLYEYLKGKFTKVLCLKNGLTAKQLDKTDCPLCKISKYGTPSNKYYAFVSDLNDDGALKLLEVNWSLGKQLDDICELFGKPLHDIVFTLSKKGVGTDTSYTPVPEQSKDDTPFNVAEYFAMLGLEDYPPLLGTSHVPILQLDEQQMQAFIEGEFPWSSDTQADGTPKRKRVMLGGSMVTLRNEQVASVQEDDDVVEDVEEMEDVVIDDTPRKGGFF